MQAQNWRQCWYSTIEAKTSYPLKSFWDYSHRRCKNRPSRLLFRDAPYAYLCACESKMFVGIIQFVLRLYL